jgi:hypothetical protein
VRKVSGPVVVAAAMGGAAMYELVRVGHRRLIGVSSAAPSAGRPKQKMSQKPTDRPTDRPTNEPTDHSLITDHRPK